MLVLCFTGEQMWHRGGDTDLDAFQTADTAESEMLGSKAF